MARLNSRDWLIYQSIKSHTANDEKGYATQREIYEDVTDSMPDSLQWNGERSHDPCFPIWSTVRKLNASPEVEKIIIIDDFKYYLATKEEAEGYMDKLREEAIRKLRRVSEISHKYGMDGQGKLLSCQDVEITDKSKAREFVESFVGAGQ